MTDPCLNETSILAFVQGSLTGSERDAAESHLAECEECRVLVSVLARSSMGEVGTGQHAIVPPVSGHSLATAATVASEGPVGVPSEDGPAGPGESERTPVQKRRGLVSPVSPGTVLAGKYRVERVLAAGGMGVVLVAHHLTLGQPFALKFLLPAAFDTPGAVARLLREARAAAQIRSEHVARVTDVGTLDDGAPYIVMELLVGSDLAEVLRRRGALPVDEAVDFVLQASEALAEAHALGIVHRDLKPANLFLSQRADGSPLVKVLDFGISKVAAAPPGASTARDVLMGSPRYMSPEQMQSARDVDARTDVWALGAILYELVTARAAFDADTIVGLCARIATADAPRIRDVRPEVPPELDAIVHDCLEKDPARRLPSVADLAERLRVVAPTRALLSIDRIRGVAGGRGSPRPAPLAPLVPASVPPAASTGDAFGGTRPVRPRTTSLGVVLGLVVAALLGAGVALVVHPATRPVPALAAGEPPASALPDVPSTLPSAPVEGRGPAGAGAGAMSAASPPSSVSPADASPAAPSASAAGARVTPHKKARSARPAPSPHLTRGTADTHQSGLSDRK